MWLASLLSCALLGGAAAENLPWYHQGTVYQLYPRSFLDTNGDGIGDLRGIIKKVDYLASLGIDAVWLNPIYPTQNKDFGYDITDYEGINPEYGTMADFEELVKKLGEKGVRVVMDYVPNHTSNLHPWFAKSVAKEDPYTNFYVWLPAKYADKNMPPNNWTGTFGGSMWKYHEGRKEMYLHQFLPEQPDLNYRSEDLIEAMKGVLTFWLKKGVAGFRMDTVATMVESDSWLDEPYNGGDPNDPGSYSHTMTTEQELTYKVLRQFKETLEKYSNETKTEPKIMMTESWCNDPLTLRKYYGTPNAPATTFPFNFLLMMRMNVYSSAKDWADAINYWYYPGPHNDSVMPGNWAQPNLVLGNHDQHRYASRFTPEHSDILRMVQMTVKGTAVVYYGDELGLTDSLVRRDQAQDIQGKLAPPGQFYEKSRDPQRGPMPWNTVDANAGFTNSTPWLPLTSDYMTNNVETQENATHSHLNNFRALTALRKRPTLLKGACQVTNSGNILLVIRELADNPTVITAVNMGHLDEILDLQSFRSTLPDRISVLVRSINYLNESKVVDSNHVRLPPLTGVVLSSWNENPAGTS